MISIPRSILSTFRTLVRKAGLHKRSTASPSGFAVVAEADGCFVRCASHEVALQHRHAGSFVPGEHRLPLDALDVIDGKQGEAVTLQTDGKNRTLLTWTDHGVPRQASFDAPKLAPFPEVPTSFAANKPTLWSALHDALPVTDKDATRYALGCLCLRGSRGRVDATDGRHVLTQAGFEFPWTDDVLLTANGLLGCKTLDVGVPVGVGRSSGWIGFSIGNWLVMVAEQKEGRWPKIDDIIPKAETAKSRLELSAHDATFLSETLPRLPNDDPHYEPITLDLNGQVLIRAREAEKARPTQVELPSSRLDGEPVVLNTNRRYLAEAIRLGFRTLHSFGPESPVLCSNDRRQYLWCLLDAKSAIPRHADPIRIETPCNRNSLATTPAAAATPPTTSTESPVTTSLKTQNQQVAASATRAHAHDANGVKRTHSRPSGSPIEQAISLRDALREAARRAGDLARSLKQQRRQNRIVASTLASLKELQRVAG